MPIFLSLRPHQRAVSRHTAVFSENNCFLGRQELRCPCQIQSRCGWRIRSFVPHVPRAGEVVCSNCRTKSSSRKAAALQVRGEADTRDEASHRRCASGIEVLRRSWLALMQSHPGWCRADSKWPGMRRTSIFQQRSTIPRSRRTHYQCKVAENKYFHSKASDEREPYRSWLAKNAPGSSFAEVPYVYADNPENPRQTDLPTIPFRRDRLQVGFDVVGGWHDMDGDADRVPYGFHAVPGYRLRVQSLWLRAG